MDTNVIEKEEIKQYIVINLGVEQYGIDISYVDNIVRMQHITRVPKVDEFLKGVIKLRGEGVPIMSIRQKIGLEFNEYTGLTLPVDTCENIVDIVIS